MFATARFTREKGVARDGWKETGVRFPSPAHLPLKMRCKASQKSFGSRTNPAKSADVHLHLNFVFFEAMEIISRLSCLVHLRIWNGTKERKPDTAAT
jgi:hypothetical protein